MFSEFLNSVYFGITAMVIVGASWCLVGLVMGDAPKKNVDTSLVQFFGAAFSCVVSLVLWVAAIPTINCSLSVLLSVCGIYAVGTFLNFYMLQLMSAAMQLGPNGVIWSIIQSAFIFPFIGGIVFFDVKFTLLRGVGIFLLLAALFCFGRVKDNSVKGADGKWKRLAFICFGIVAIQQNLTTAPSYFEEAREIPSIVRTLASSFGVLFAAVICNSFKIAYVLILIQLSLARVIALIHIIQRVVLRIWCKDWVAMMMELRWLVCWGCIASSLTIRMTRRMLGRI